MGNRIYFNTALAEYIVIADGTSDYITKDDFDAVQVILFLIKCLKEITVVLVFCF